VGGSILLGGLGSKTFASSGKKISAADQINVGVIGVNGMGWTNARAAVKVPGVNLVAICDIDQNVITKRAGELPKMGIDQAKVKTYGDYRQVLDRKDIDAIIIGTPDHWHALIMMNACEAGKDVYVEKPVGNSIMECRSMVAAKNKYKRIVQGGQWQRSQQHFKDAVDFVYSGQLGDIRTVKVWCYQGWMKPDIIRPDSAPPPGVNYPMWLGPAPTVPFNASRFHFNFRWFWDYAGGLMTDWGVHLIDYALLGMKAGTPTKVSALGGKFAYPDRAEETPDTLMALYEFEHFNMLWDHAVGIDNGSYGRDHGIAYIGNNGTLVLDRGGWEVIEEKNASHKVSKPLSKASDNGVEKHWVNFIDAVRSRREEDLHCPIEAGAHVATVAQMGNITFRSGKPVVWDKPAGKFQDDLVNAKYMMKEYHNGYSLPKV
jgi:predicted dehydrogenase